MIFRPYFNVVRERNKINDEVGSLGKEAFLYGYRGNSIGKSIEIVKGSWGNFSY